MKLGLSNDSQLSVTPGMYVFLAFLLLLLPLRWVLALAASTLVHELSHAAVIHLFGIKIHGITVELGAVRLHTEPMTNVQELFCALAGPLGGLCLLLFARWIPATAVCAAFQSFYNLLPLQLSDGSRILRCGASLLMPQEKAERFSLIIGNAFLVCIVVLGFWGTFYLGLGLLPLGASLVILLKNKKMTCKADGQAVQ